MTTNDTSRIGLQRQIDTLRVKIKALEKGKKTVTAPSVSRVERIAEDLAELKARFDGALAQGAFEVRDLKDRIERLESGPAPNIPANDPEPPVDTAWHPYDARFDGPAGMHPDGNQRVVVMLRDGSILRPEPAADWNWKEAGITTIVAWRYAKEGE